MARVLVTGGTGVMGSVLVERLRAAGHTVRVLALPDDPRPAALREAECEFHSGDITRPATLRGMCRDIDVVYHCAAVIIAFNDDLYRSVNVEGTRNVLAEAREARVAQFVYVSSASVVYPRTTAYSCSKRQCEELVRQSGLTWTIVRPTLVYAKQCGGEEFDRFLQYLTMLPVVFFIGAGRAVKRPVYVEDVIDGLVLLCGNRAAADRVYNFSGAEAISMRSFARLCLIALGRPAVLVAGLPVWLCRISAWCLQKVMQRPPLRWPVIAGVIQDADLDPGPAIREVGYRPCRVSEKLPLCFPRAKGR